MNTWIPSSVMSLNNLIFPFMMLFVPTFAIKAVSAFLVEPLSDKQAIIKYTYDSSCIDMARATQDLIRCGEQIRGYRTAAERTNQIIKSHCDNIIVKDAQARKDAAANIITWDKYEDVKKIVLAEKAKCHVKNGSYYQSYRDSMEIIRTESKNLRRKHWHLLISIPLP